MQYLPISSLFYAACLFRLSATQKSAAKKSIKDHTPYICSSKAYVCRKKEVKHERIQNDRKKKKEKIEFKFTSTLNY